MDKKLLMIILHFLFVVVFYALAAMLITASIPNRDTYNLVTAILLFVVADRHQKEVSEELDELDESEEK